MTVQEKVAYLKGLAEGLGIDSEKKEGKLISVIIDTLEDIAFELADFDESASAIMEEIDAISDDLADVEEFVFGTDDDCCCCGHNHDDDDDDDDDDFVYSVTCPSCNTEFVVEEDEILGGEVECPDCGETLEIEVDDDDEFEEEDED